MKKVVNKIFGLRLTALLFLYFILPVNNFSQVKFYATTSSVQIEEGDVFELRFTLENAEGLNFIPPSLKSFELVAGPSRSSEMSIINGISQSKLSFIYSIKAGNAATYYIPPAQIKTGNKILKSNPLTIKVVKAAKKDFSNIAKRDNFFVTAEISDKSAYPGQQLLLEYKLYTSVKIEGIMIESEPDLKDFKIENADFNSKDQSITIKNKQFSVYSLKSVILFPLKTGQMIIPSAKFLVEVPEEKSGNIFFQSTKPYHLTTESIKLEVKKLPGNAAESFSGHVGQFKIKSRISSTDQILDEAFSFILDIASDASENSVLAPDFKDKNKNFEIYDPKLISQSQSFQNGKLITTKSYEYLLVPKKEGRQTITIPYTFFDPEKAIYISTSTDPVEVNVKKGIRTNKQIQKTETSLKPSKSELNLSKTKKPLFGSFLYFSLLGLMVVVLMILYFLRLSKQKNKALDPGIIKLKQADREALKRLNSAKELMLKADEKLFFREIYEVLIKFASDKLLLPQSEINSENLFKKLTEEGIFIDNANKFIEQLSNCEAALYSGTLKQDLRETYDSVHKIISDLQTEFKNIK
ncbi:MAG: protein BatD [Saprospiraceae bacterium]|nr:protein BatD [Saprospiraceae bacterium]